MQTYRKNKDDKNAQLMLLSHLLTRTRWVYSLNTPHFVILSYICHHLQIEVSFLNLITHHLDKLLIISNYNTKIDYFIGIFILHNLMNWTYNKEHITHKDMNQISTNKKVSKVYSQ